MTVLVWGLEEDSPTRIVRRRLAAMEVDHVFLNQADILSSHSRFEYGDADDGCITIRRRRLPIESISAWFVRPYDFRELPQVRRLPKPSTAWSHAGAFEGSLWSHANVAVGLVVNRPASMLSNTSKPLQSAVIGQLGFDVPETLITTDPDAAREFCAQYGSVVYKSISGQRSIVGRLDPADDSRLNDLHWCPTQFQEWIDGIDVRVHVVGERTFSTAVRSPLTDYRYGPASYRPYDLSADVAERCVRLARALGLHLAGIDLRRTRDGRWYCFEANPSPAYSAYELQTGQPISQAIAEDLAAA
jgi:hypothetical protein